LTALAAYLTTVLPGVQKELRRWRKLAEAIPDPEQRGRALAALEEKRSNVEAVAVFATLAPLRRRRAVLRAIVPLQVAIDYRDTLEEAGTEDAERDGYLIALETGWARETECLVGYGAVAPALRTAVDRCREGQRQTHAAAAGDSGELKRWASALTAPPCYRWWELAAGASSSVAAHALIAAAADRRVSSEQATLIDRAYNPAVGALTVLLDDLIDREDDALSGDHSYIGYYSDASAAAARLVAIAGDAQSRLRPLQGSGRHRAILAGVVGFYSSDEAARTSFAAPVAAALRAELGPSARLIATAVVARRRFAQAPDANSEGSPG
jgi:tetraprenyl-beta-curcumene synthase